MEILKQKKEQFVRILIGLAETGQSGIKAPIKTINVEGDNPEDIYEELKEFILKKDKRT